MQYLGSHRIVRMMRKEKDEDAGFKMQSRYPLRLRNFNKEREK